MTEVEQRLPPRAGTDWSAIFTATLIPLTVAAGFVYFGLDPSEAGDWVHGLLALIPLEFFRALVFSILSETYREYRSPMQAVRFFLISLAILTGIALVISLYVLKGDWWAWITTPEVYHAIAFALALIAADGVIGVYFFRGDPKLLSVRLEAVADDARDWLQLGGIQLPVVLALLYAFLLLLHETQHVLPWLPYPTNERVISALLFYAAFYFAGKALLLAHASTAAFNKTGRRLFGASWIQVLIWEKNKDRALSANTERAAEKRRRAVLTGDADG
ncbi:MAG TPA: hypothetical protein VFV97_14505 [Rhodanobacteraceae bacterium]|nr:hypothetical protein [Rhodanobacteraceae bacterium]